ncbi:ECF transporter S component [Heliobacterium undosum]|uniref:ECF transporter S component n=1 Tax=Heliomicrobium undosum TaxID=121734 RepID=A0A845L2H1_9FIRM|nr:ECF transporter S component [Heliomicrobium undosum]MZP30453.1 ECF transporter S component [Heliomicrobium undosum]
MNITLLTRTALLLALALLFTQVKLQWVSGPAVNALLIIATAANGLWSGVLLGALTPVLAFLGGFMPLVFVVPVIAAGNILFCVTFAWLHKRNGMAAVAAGATLKFLLLALSVNYLIQVPPPVAKALSLPQLFTALAGGALALLLLRYLPARD